MFALPVTTMIAETSGHCSTAGCRLQAGRPINCNATCLYPAANLSPVLDNHWRPLL